MAWVVVGLRGVLVLRWVLRWQCHAVRLLLLLGGGCIGWLVVWRLGRR